MAESKFSLGAAGVVALASGVLLLKLGLDLKSGLLSLMKFQGIHPQDVSLVIIMVAVALVALGSKCLVALVLSPFTVHTTAETWALMSPSMKRTVLRCARKRQDVVEIEGDLAFEALQITSMKKERNLSLKRDAMGARLIISWEMSDYARKKSSDTPKNSDTRRM